MATVMKNLLKAVTIGGVAAAILGCPIPDISLKTAIKGLAAPPNVGSLKIITPASKTFKLSWTDPADKDIDHIEISFATPFASNAPPPPVNVAVGVQNATVTVPLNGVWYFITVKSVDKAGNKSAGITPVNLFNQSAKALPYTSGLASYQLNYTVTSGVLPGTQSSYQTYSYSGGTSGNLTAQSNYSGAYPGGALTSHDSYTYDSRGNLTLDDYYSDSPTPNTLSSYTAYTYDSAGNMTSQIYLNASSVQLNGTTYEYDSNGNLTTATYYGSVGVVQSSQTYQYDSNYHVTKLSSYDSTGTLTGSYSFVWDPTTNFPSKWTFYDNTGAVQGWVTFSVSPGLLTDTSYSPSGVAQSTSTVVFNANGLEVQDTYNGVTNATYNYDINGNKIDQVYYSSGTADQHNTWGSYY